MASLVTTVAQDVRYALRQLKRSPGFAITAIVTLALGIGANTAIFTLAHSVLLRKLPVTDPKSLYRVGDGDDCCINGGMPDKQVYSDFSTDAYHALRDNLPEFEQLAATPSGGGNGPSLAKRAGTNEVARYVRSSYVSGNYFDLFRINAERGRLITPRDDHEGAPPVAVMSYATWVNQYQSDPNVVGASFLLANHPITIIGITPESFYGDRVQNRTPDFYLPIGDEPIMSDWGVSKNPRLRWLYLIGRVKPDVNMAVLQEKVNNTLRAFLAAQKDYKEANAARELPKVRANLVSAATGIEQLQSQVGKGLKILMGISALVLLIACANIANLMLARGMTRRAETSVRVALGAARARIVRQVLTESIVLALIGGAVGVLLAFGGARAMLALAFPEARNLPITAAPSIPVLLFTCAVAIVTGVLFGVAPAWSATKSQPADALRGLNRTSHGGSTLPQRSLVVLQAMLSLVLITVAALLTRSLSNLQHQNFGLETENRFVLHMDPTASGYTPDRFEGLMRQLGDRISAIPGTKRVAFANYSPLEGNNWGEGVFVEGRPDPQLHADIYASWDRVSPGFFQTIGQPLLRGRDFSQTDRKETPGVAVVNETFVRKFFPKEDPLGKRFGTDLHKVDFTIVGVVADAKYTDISEKVRPMFFRSELQPNPHADPKDQGEMVSLAPHTVMVQTTGAQGGYEQQLRNAFKDVDSNLAIIDLRSLNSQIADQLNDSRMVARLTGAFGILALVLASVGLYGVTAYSVAQRVPEIGLRMALGSDRRGVMTMVLKGAMLQALIGLAIGVPAALIAGHFLQSQLFGIKGHDAVTLLMSCGALALAALIASAVPARRASAIEPMRALRAE